MNYMNIPGYIGIACILIAAALRLRTALKDRRERKHVNATARCTSGCGEDIHLNEKHVTVNRHVEYMDSEDSVTVLDAEPVAFYHLRCAPDDLLDAESRSRVIEVRSLPRELP